MNKKAFKLFYLTFSIFLIGIVLYNCSYGQAFTIPENPFPELKGPYKVGTHEYYWIDTDRNEIYTKIPEDKRHLIVQVWYPAEAVENPVYHPYIAHPEEFGNWEGFNRVLHVKTNSVQDAPLSNKLQKYPVLVFSHGFGWTRFTSTYITEMLANHGYIVFSVDHTFFNKTKVFPDGYSTKADTLMEWERSSDLMEDFLISEEHHNKYWLKTWAEDASFVLDKIEELDVTSGQRFYNRLDLDKIGMLGWSFGGAASAQLCRDDSRLKAGVNCDGRLFGDVWETGIDKPFMIFSSERTFLSKEENEKRDFDHSFYLKFMKVGPERRTSFINKSNNDIFYIDISRSTHADFSDLILFYPRRPKSIETNLCQEIVNTYILSFFDKYLRSIDNELLDKVPSKYTEVKFFKK